MFRGAPQPSGGKIKCGRHIHDLDIVAASSQVIRVLARSEELAGRNTLDRPTAAMCSLARRGRGLPRQSTAEPEAMLETLRYLAERNSGCERLSDCKRRDTRGPGLGESASP